jgi:hypothetical protein
VAVSSLRRLVRVAQGHELHVLCLKPCKRCGEPFEHCRSCEPGRLYCLECAPIASRERERRAHRTYRHSPEGKQQHHDEEHERRKRRRKERKAGGPGGRDRRCVVPSGRLQVVSAAARSAAEEPRSDRMRESPPVEWILVAWPGLLALARRLLGTEMVCPFCGRVGRVVRLVALDEWRRRRVPRGVG